MDQQTEQQRLDEKTRRAAEKARAESDRITGEVSRRRQRIEVLQDQRQGITNGEISPGEAIANAKESLNRNMKAFDALLKKILEGFKAGRTDSFKESSMRLMASSDSKLAALLLGCVTDGDLERVGKTLDAGGPSKSQREKKIQAIDREISQLESEIEAILA